ncbi:hypothetical protein ACIOEX_08055 [Streptomyces sp. NPDC087850]
MAITASAALAARALGDQRCGTGPRTVARRSVRWTSNSTGAGRMKASRPA